MGNAKNAKKIKTIPNGTTQQIQTANSLRMSFQVSSLYTC